MPPKKSAKKKPAAKKPAAKTQAEEVMEAAGVPAPPPAPPVIPPPSPVNEEAEAQAKAEESEAIEAALEAEPAMGIGLPKETQEEAPAKIEIESDPKCPVCDTVIEEEMVRKIKDRPNLKKIYFDCPVCKTDRIAKVHK